MKEGRYRIESEGRKGKGWKVKVKDGRKEGRRERRLRKEGRKVKDGSKKSKG